MGRLSKGILIAILLFPASVLAFGLQMVGGGSTGTGATECATQSYDVQFTTKNTYSTMYDDQERGQSWISGVSGDLYSISLERENGGTEDSLILRVGTASDLSGTCPGGNCLAEFTCYAPTSAGFFECVIPSDNRPSLTSSTTYYFLFQHSYTGQWDISRDSGNNYANGIAYYDLTENWIGTASSSNDLPFKTRMCD